MDRLVAQANTLNDVPRSSRFSVTGNGNPFPNTYDSGPHPNDYQLGGMSTVAGEYGAPGNDEEDLFQYINYEPDGQAVVSPLTFVIHLKPLRLVPFLGEALEHVLSPVKNFFPRVVLAIC